MGQMVTFEWLVPPEPAYRQAASDKGEDAFAGIGIFHESRSGRYNAIRAIVRNSILKHEVSS
jgi:hypothetical protein